MLFYRYLDGGRGVEFKASGRLTRSEFVGVLTDIRKRDLIAQPLFYSWFEYDDDLSYVEMSAAEFRSAAKASLHASQRQPVTRVSAIYAKNDEPFAREKDWQSVVAPIVDSEVFRNRPAALEWLRKRVAERHGFKIEL